MQNIGTIIFWCNLVFKTILQWAMVVFLCIPMDFAPSPPLVVFLCIPTENAKNQIWFRFVSFREFRFSVQKEKISDSVYYFIFRFRFLFRFRFRFLYGCASASAPHFVRSEWSLRDQVDMCACALPTWAMRDEDSRSRYWWYRENSAHHKVLAHHRSIWKTRQNQTKIDLRTDIPDSRRRAESLLSASFITQKKKRGKVNSSQKNLTITIKYRHDTPKKFKTS